MKRIFTICFLLIVFNGFSQIKDTLAIQDFETSPQTPTWTFSGTPVYNSGYSSSGAAPPSSEIGIGGSRAWELTQVSGGTALEFANVSIPSGYDSVKFSFRLAAMNLNGSTGGPDDLDWVLIEVSTNGGSSYYSRMRMRGAVNNNSFWAYSATAVGEVYYTPTTEVTFQPTNSGLNTTEGYSTGIIVFPGNIGQVRIKITMRSSSSSDTWLMDNVVLVGEKTCPKNLGSSRTVEICQGNGFFVGGKIQTTAGVYYDTLKTKDGCDSVLKTTLAVNPVYNIQLNTSICQGDSILLGGQYRKVPGTYDDNLKTAKNCDSIIHTTLIVNPAYKTLQSVSICQGDSTMAGGMYQRTAGTYYDTLQSALGCDSIIETMLTVNPTYSVPLTYTICQGDSILLAGKYQKIAGTYIDVLATAKGCDSTIVSTLVINPVYSISQTATICQGDSILLGGAWQTTTGVYTDSLMAGKGCDSIIMTSLIVNPSYTWQTNMSICAGQSILVNGNPVSAPGVYTDSLKTTNGCDSLIEITLAVNAVNIGVTQNANVLTAAVAGAQYQWLDCNNGNSPINGETNQTFTATVDGDYAVEITENACVDTSICYTVLGIGVKETQFANGLKVYPNPAGDQLWVELNQLYPEVRVEILTITGQKVAGIEAFNEQIIFVNTQTITPGIYLLRVSAGDKESTSKLAIE